MYLAIFDCAISVVLFWHIRDRKQRPIYYVSKAMVNVETWYYQVEQITLALKSVAWKLCLKVLLVFLGSSSDHTYKLAAPSHLAQFGLSGRMLKWAIELSEYGIKYQLWLSLKWQVMTDFITKFPKKQTHSIDCPKEQWWTLHVDGVSRVSKSGVGLVLQSPTGELMEQTIRLSFSTSNNET